jgi:hypothetical protein
MVATVWGTAVALWLIVSLAQLPQGRMDFVYPGFNNTQGLIFNGAAGTTSCRYDERYIYGDRQGFADTFGVDVVSEIQESTDFIYERSTETNNVTFNEEIESSLAGFLHRNDTQEAPMRCDTIRTRLTPSNPSKVGSMWFRDPIPFTNGFDTQFTFQITDHSKECTLVKDQYFSQRSYRTCSVHGGDGFAFVIQNSKNASSAVGRDGAQMGFGGIENSLAIAFDMWTNPGNDQLGVDHISVQSKGSGVNTALEDGLIGLPRAHNLADGVEHLVRIRYFGDLRIEYLNKLVASESLLQYIKDNGEQKRVGTLVVNVDEGVASDEPILALPINLSVVIKSEDDKAHVGFTAATGRFYQKHDITSWHWCDQQPCQEKEKSTFDYHQTSRFSSVPYRVFSPGLGFGGSGDPNQDFPITNTNPDTTAWEVPEDYFARGVQPGLSVEAPNQVPPNTLH